MTVLFRSDAVDKNTYDVSAGGAEGVRPAHIQMSAVHAEQNLYVVKAVCLQWRQKDQQNIITVLQEGSFYSHELKQHWLY